MKKIFFSHPDITLAGIAFVLLAILIGLFSWSINDVVLEVHRATVASGTASGQGFDLQSAARIDLHGVSTSSAPSTVLTPPPASVVFSTSTTSSTSTIPKTAPTSSSSR